LFQTSSTVSEVAAAGAEVAAASPPPLAGAGVPPQAASAALAPVRAAAPMNERLLILLVIVSSPCPSMVVAWLAGLELAGSRGGRTLCSPFGRTEIGSSSEVSLGEWGQW